MTQEESSLQYDGITILYVDDEEINLLLFKHSFSDKYHVLTTASPLEALDMLEQNNKVNIIISDMRMPEMDGLSFIKKAKQIKPEVPCFILTGYLFGEDIEKALRDDLIQGSFTKPFNVAKIDFAIKSVLNDE